MMMDCAGGGRVMSLSIRPDHDTLHLTSPASPISPSSTDTAHFPRMSFINGCGLINRNHARISTYPLYSSPTSRAFHVIYRVLDDQARFQSEHLYTPGVPHINALL